MYYRYEARRCKWGSSGYETDWEGICQIWTPDQSRKMSQFLHTPKWYESNPDVDSRCWFTQYGYDKYHERVEELLANCDEWYFPIEVRLLKQIHIDNIVCDGKVQCICLA